MKKNVGGNPAKITNKIYAIKGFKITTLRNACKLDNTQTRSRLTMSLTKCHINKTLCLRVCVCTDTLIVQ
jgi:hypothetical protein